MMAMKRCKNGHFFNPEKHSGCPYCGSRIRLPDTKAFNEDNPGSTEAWLESSEGLSPVTGWLVCVAGPEKGTAFTLRSGHHFIGRSLNMQIKLKKDLKVSRSKHGVVTYDPRHNEFWISPSDATGLMYLNGKLVTEKTVLKDKDRIEAGESCLVFVPFCTSDFRWDAFQEKN